MTTRLSALALLLLLVAAAPLAANDADRNCRGLVALTDLDHAVEPGIRVPASERAPAHCRVRGVVNRAIRFPDDYDGILAGLTAGQIQTAKYMYEDVVDADGNVLSPGVPPGAEDAGDWAAWVLPDGAARRAHRRSTTCATWRRRAAVRRRRASSTACSWSPG